ncbi:glycoside hydrolase family 43 protein [Parabacteroides sp. AM08-6]|uniref:glycoside hydrolase family 43 protein n=1 Tax=Parabacteroides sp. AM08-6 TaxID=2292053 RepID=UPI000F001AFA|nr:glycoside hydrolase family 43 protein [Parabacteroides sp. AM08-6]RHJ87774.1 carbohydrate-binding protein [Parabacteroides sp. AM08-6]
MNKLKSLGLFSLLVLTPVAVLAQNPIIQTNYTADPAPMMYNDKVYLYTSHDEDGSTWFTMNDWRLYTTNDMVNWTDHGAVMSYTDFSWAKGNAWAAQCIERDGKFYLYTPLTAKDNQGAIGVAVADSPYGPFIDPLGKPLVRSGHGDIDPTVFIDDDGQAYLYWGNPNCYYVKLNEDMISYEGDIVRVPMTVESFGKRDGNQERPTLYEEGPWLYKHDGMYYLLYAGGPVPEHLGYATSNKPTGPWKYGGVLMPTEGRSFTNHPGIIDFRGKTYLFYHNGSLPGGGGFTRSVCVDELNFNKDKSFPQLKMGSGLEKPLATLNPYVKTEAETIAWSEGVKSYKNNQVGVFITAMKNGSYTKVRNVDFREKGASKFFARVGTTHNGGVEMEVRLDEVDGALIGTIRVPCTGGDDRWALVDMDIAPVKGVHDVFFIFKGHAPSNIMYFDYWKFAE